MPILIAELKSSMERPRWHSDFKEVLLLQSIREQRLEATLVREDTFPLFETFN